VAVAVPAVDVAAPDFNLDETLKLATRAASENAILAVFPELGLSAYSNEDLFLQDALLDAVESSLARLLEASRDLPLLFVVGAPLPSENRLFNCAIVVYRGHILGITPKTYLPNYREFYEKRQFTSGAKAVAKTFESYRFNWKFRNAACRFGGTLSDSHMSLPIPFSATNAAMRFTTSRFRV
jgi:NAD+ synthase (glutamine-hydrolysing)